MANGLGPGFRQGISNLATAISQRKQISRETQRSEKIAKAIEDVEPGIASFLREGGTLDEALAFSEFRRKDQPNKLEEFILSQFSGQQPTQQPGQQLEQRPMQQPEQQPVQQPGQQPGKPILRGATIGGLKFEFPQSEEEINRNVELELDRLRREGKVRIKIEAQKGVLKRVEKLKGLLPLLDTFDSQLKVIPAGKGVPGRIAGVVRATAAPLQADPFVSSARAQLTALRPLIARGFGDVGNLTAQEQKSAVEFIPRDSDNAETRVLKSLGGLSLLRNKLSFSLKEAGLESDPELGSTIAEIDSRLQQKIAEAIELGLDDEKVRTFIGKGAAAIERKKTSQKSLTQRRVVRANLIARQNPDLSREEIIAQANEEIQ